MTWKRISLVTVFIAALLGAASYVTRGLSDFDLTAHTLTPVGFEFDGSVLAGTLVTPDNVSAPPIAILVHGDGPQDRFSGDGYLPLINALTDAGIAVFSWDKPGVGQSTGNWLDQTMTDRAKLAIAAYSAIGDLDQTSGSPIGFLGFSQAGWVLPRVATQITPAFTVLVGPAVSWRDQGTYFSRIEMTTQGLANDVIEQALTERNLRNDQLFSRDGDQAIPKDMNPDRFWFVANAYLENSTVFLSQMRGPVLAIWGQDDLNVDAKSDATVFRNQLMPLSHDRRVIVIKNATHGLLSAPKFNYQLSSDWPWYRQLAFLAQGRNAYADKAIAEITEWIISVS